ncbi:hypothetical protein H310_03262 [Aphanomyces invadans]|uniref:Uncharacterized protein n=1 Tax=Aphanomyces invadans TaxID=157072 RepID=A0A024UGU9_9STRA|nr:hypothetical protein H310_03262 [Aphanomyces invadans]ETW05504.1 hypothetical protein H310_03262 [Aphanomyces invadans]|eukprot:XP_008865281.1 hypothetical protein H310_03262 [Aphanomyces invadans]
MKVVPTKRLASVVRGRVKPVLELLQKASPSAKHLSAESQQLLAELSRTKRRVSRFWIEKGVVVVDALQIYGLMWQLAQIWPWPSKWLALTRWTVLFNLDFLSLMPTGAGMGQATPAFSHWGDLPHYWVYALVFAMMPYVLTLGSYAAFRRWRASGDVAFLSKRAVLENRVLFVLQFMYLPIGLTVGRLWHCQDSINPLDPTQLVSTMSVDATVSCGGAMHSASLICIAGVLGLPFLVGFPVWLRRSINIVGAFGEPDRHEHFIQGKELAYLLHVSDDYYVLNVAQYASYTQKMRLFPVHVCVWKLVLLAIFTFGRSRYPSLAMQPMQGTGFAMVVLVVVSYRSWWASPYRCRSTAQLSFIVDVLLAFDAVMVVLSANPIKSALTVASVKVAVLGFVHTVGAILVMSHLVGTWWKKRARQLNWPTHIHMQALVHHVPQVTAWVAALKAADHVLQRSFALPAQVQPMDELAAVVTELQKCAAEAAGLDHLLHDLLHETAAIVHAAHVEALGSAVLTAERIDDCVHAFTSQLEHYKDKHDTLHPHKRNALRTLHVAKTWQVPAGLCQVTVQPKQAPAESDMPHNAFLHIDVCVSAVPELNLPSNVSAFSAILRPSIPHAPRAEEAPDVAIAVHWSAILAVESPAWIESPAQHCDVEVAVVVQFDNPWLLVKLALLDDSGWTVLQGWVHVASPAVCLLHCHDSNSVNLFHDLQSQQQTRQLIPSPVDASVVAALIDASRAASKAMASPTLHAKLQQQWRQCIQQWTIHFVRRFHRLPTDADKAKIRLWYSLYHALKASPPPPHRSHVV